MKKEKISLYARAAYSLKDFLILRRIRNSSYQTLSNYQYKIGYFQQLKFWIKNRSLNLIYLFNNEHGEYVSYILLNKIGDDYYITIATDPKHRNKGYAYRSVTYTVKHILNSIPSVNIKTEILKSNFASIKTFTKAGFKMSNEIEGKLIFTYQGSINAHEKTLDICIPYISPGLPCLEFLIKNIFSSASNPDLIRILVSYHNEEDLSLLKKSECFEKINEVVFSPSFPKELLFVGSANHSLAANNLLKHSKSDIFMLCDYDMAFLRKGWDKIIKEALYDQGYEIFGVPYQPYEFNLDVPFLNQHMPWLKEIPVKKYQERPMVSFIALKNLTLTNIFNRNLTNFSDFLNSGSLPFRIINTPKLAEQTQLDLGTIQWLDSGWELTDIIEKNHLTFKLITPIPYETQSLFSTDNLINNKNKMLLPEVYDLDNDSNYFLAHYKKGTAKFNAGLADDDFIKFCNSINSLVNLK